VSQRALIAAEIVTTTIGKPPKDSKAISSTAAAERLNVSRSSVSEARAIKKHGSPELVKAVADGKIDIRSAGKVARESAEKQKEVVAQASAEPAPRKQNDAQFNRQKWRDRVEKVYSSALAKAPADMQDWARGTFRDVCGGSLRKEATLNIPDGDDVTMYDAEDVIARIEGMLKEIPISERKDIKQAVGKHFIGQKPEQYLPELSAEETDADRVAVVVGELKNRQKQMESLEDVSKVLKQAISGLRRIVKAESDASE
jgi:hypothetical protein